MRTPSAAKFAAPAATPVPAATPAAAISTSKPTPSTNSNPFANTTFASATPKPAAVNPFAAISFAPTPANKTTTFNNKPIATSTKKKRPSTDTNANANTALSPLRPGAAENEKIPMDASTKCNLELLKMAQKQSVDNALSDWTPLMRKYIQNMNDVKNGKGGETSTSTSSSSAPASAFVSVPASKSSTGAFKSNFSFAAPAPSPAKDKDGETSTSTSKPLFSFASSPAPAAPSKPFTGFSFGSPATSTPAPAPAPAPAAAPEKEADASASTEDDKASGTDKVLAAEANENEEELFACRAIYRREIMVDGKKELKSFAAAPTRLMRNKDDGKSKVLQRNGAGAVMLNVAISKGANITVHSKDTKKNKGTVMFISTIDEEVGNEKIWLTTKLANFDEMVKNLKIMAGEN